MMSHYGTVRDTYLRLYGAESWISKRESRWATKTTEEQKLDRDLFYSLVELDSISNFSLQFPTRDRKKLKTKKSIKLARDLILRGASNDYLFYQENIKGKSHTWTALDVAIVGGLDDITELILAKYPEEVNKKDEYYHSPLYFAFLLNPKRLPHMLIEKSANDVALSWILGNVDGKLGRPVWDYIMENGHVRNQIEDAFCKIKDRGMLGNLYGGFRVILEYITEYCGTTLIEELFDWNGKNNPLFFPLIRQNRQPLFLGSLLSELGLQQEIVVHNTESGIIFYNGSDNIILISEAEAPDYLEPGKLFLKRHNGIWVNIIFCP